MMHITSRTSEPPILENLLASSLRGFLAFLYAASAASFRSFYSALKKLSLNILVCHNIENIRYNAMKLASSVVFGRDCAIATVFVSLSEQSSLSSAQCTAPCNRDGFQSRILQCVWYGSTRPAGNACRDQQRPQVMRPCKGPPCQSSE